MKTTLSIVACLLAIPAPALAQADPNAQTVSTAPPPSEKPDRGAFVAGAKVGAALPFDGLSPMVSGTLEVGYVLPWLKRSFGLLVDVAYTVPTTNGTTMNDPRVDNMGSYNWQLTQKELTISPAIYYRLTMLNRVVPYIGAGPRIYLHESIVQGSVGGQAIQPTKEDYTKVGVFVPIGVAIKLGPGELLGEFALEWGDLNWVATGNSNTLGGNVQLGYRFLL